MDICKHFFSDIAIFIDHDAAKYARHSVFGYCRYMWIYFFASIN